MSIIVPTLLLAAVAVGAFAAAVVALWRHHQGEAVDARFRSYDETPSALAPTRTEPIAA